MSQTITTITIEERVHQIAKALKAAPQSLHHAQDSVYTAFLFDTEEGPETVRVQAWGPSTVMLTFICHQATAEHLAKAYVEEQP